MNWPQPPFPIHWERGGRKIRSKVKPGQKGWVGESVSRISFYFSLSYSDFIGYKFIFPQVVSLLPLILSWPIVNLSLYFLSPIQLKRSDKAALVVPAVLPGPIHSIYNEDEYNYQVLTWPQKQYLESFQDHCYRSIWFFGWKKKCNNNKLTLSGMVCSSAFILNVLSNANSNAVSESGECGLQSHLL